MSKASEWARTWEKWRSSSGDPRMMPSPLQPFRAVSRNNTVVAAVSYSGALELKPKEIDWHDALDLAHWILDTFGEPSSAKAGNPQGDSRPKDG